MGATESEVSRTYQEQVEECVQFIGPRLTAAPAWGIILGTGQGALGRPAGGRGRPALMGSCPISRRPPAPAITAVSVGAECPGKRSCSARAASMPMKAIPCAR